MLSMWTWHATTKQMRCKTSPMNDCIVQLLLKKHPTPCKTVFFRSIYKKDLLLTQEFRKRAFTFEMMNTIFYTSIDISLQQYSTDHLLEDYQIDIIHLWKCNRPINGLHIIIIRCFENSFNSYIVCHNLQELYITNKYLR